MTSLRRRFFAGRTWRHGLHRLSLFIRIDVKCLLDIIMSESTVTYLTYYKQFKKTCKFYFVDLSTDFWRRQADELGLDFAVYRPRGLPICVMTLKGNRPELPSIMLNSHADVVVADEVSLFIHLISLYWCDKGSLLITKKTKFKPMVLKFVDYNSRLVTYFIYVKSLKSSLMLLNFNGK